MSVHSTNPKLNWFLFDAKLKSEIDFSSSIIRKIATISSSWESVAIYLEYVNTRDAIVKENFGSENLIEVALRDWGWEISDDVEPVEE